MDLSSLNAEKSDFADSKFEMDHFDEERLEMHAEMIRAEG